MAETGLDYRQLGTSGLTVSTVGLGGNNFGWRIGPEESTAVVEAALDCGITFFDTADIYGGQGNKGASERYLGAALQGHRDSVVISTKFGMAMDGDDHALPIHEARGSRRYIRSAVENSLRRLGTDRIDLFQLHQPDPRTPVEETMQALDDLVRDGKVLYVGGGGGQMRAWQFSEAWWTAKHNGLSNYVAVQAEWSLLARENEADIVPACEAHNVSILPFFPLASGLLTGKYNSTGSLPMGSRLLDPAYRGILNESNIAKVDALRTIAEQYGITMVQLAIGWLASHRIVGSVIVGARSPDQVRSNVASSGWRPDSEALQLIDDVTLTST